MNNTPKGQSLYNGRYIILDLTLTFSCEDDLTSQQTGEVKIKILKFGMIIYSLQSRSLYKPCKETFSRLHL